jgi:predicted ABC-type ATPase
MKKSNPQVVVIAGPNGAGKSTYAPTLLRDTFGLLHFVNADTISEGLSAFRPEAASFDAGRVMMLSALRQLAESKESFAFESTLATRSYVSRIMSLRRMKYEFHLLFRYLGSADLAVETVATRVRSGGHDIDEVVIRRRYKRGLANFINLYQPIADTWAVYDNSRASPLLVAFGGRQQEALIVQPEIWTKLKTQSSL